jgi:hypothetical protein
MILRKQGEKTHTCRRILPHCLCRLAFAFQTCIHLEGNLHKVAQLLEKGCPGLTLLIRHCADPAKVSPSSSPPLRKSIHINSAIVAVKSIFFYNLLGENQPHKPVMRIRPEGGYCRRCLLRTLQVRKPKKTKGGRLTLKAHERPTRKALNPCRQDIPPFSLLHLLHRPRPQADQADEKQLSYECAPHCSRHYGQEQRTLATDKGLLLDSACRIHSFLSKTCELCAPAETPLQQTQGTCLACAHIPKMYCAGYLGPQTPLLS